MARKTNYTVNGHEYYRIRKTVGYDANGKAIVKSFYGESKKDAEDKAKAFLASRDTTVDPKAYMSQVIDYYMTNVFMKGNHAPGTKLRYTTVYNLHIKGDPLTHRKMSEINSRAVQDFINSKADLSPSVVGFVRKVLSLFFKYADREGYCRNPMPSVSTPKLDTNNKTITVFTDEEIKKMLNGSGEMRDLIAFALGTGLRQAELRGLRYKDIKGDAVIVSHQMVMDVEKNNVDTGTKTKNSIRRVPLPASLQAMIEERSVGKNPNDLVFGTSTGTPYDKSNLIRVYHKYQKSVGVPPKKFHALRSTYATRLCEHGVGIQTVASLLGNTVAVAVQYYAFVSDKTKDKAAELMEGLFAP